MSKLKITIDSKTSNQESTFLDRMFSGPLPSQALLSELMLKHSDFSFSVNYSFIERNNSNKADSLELSFFSFESAITVVSELHAHYLTIIKKIIVNRQDDLFLTELLNHLYSYKSLDKDPSAASIRCSQLLNKLVKAKVTQIAHDLWSNEDHEDLKKSINPDTVTILMALTDKVKDTTILFFTHKDIYYKIVKSGSGHCLEQFMGFSLFFNNAFSWLNDHKEKREMNYINPNVLYLSLSMFKTQHDQYNHRFGTKPLTHPEQLEDSEMIFFSFTYKVVFDNCLFGRFTLPEEDIKMDLRMYAPWLSNYLISY